MALGALTILAGLAQPASAHECEGCASSPSVSFWSAEWNPSFYVGAGLQQSQFKDWGFISRIDPGSYTSRSEDDADTGFRLSAGLDFLEYFGAEVSYADFGEASFTGQSDGSGTILAPGTQRETVALDGYALHLIARMPIAGDFSLSGRAGAGHFKAQGRASGTAYQPPGGGGVPTPFSGSESESSTRFSWAAGVEYDGFKPVRVALAYEAATFKAIGADTFGVSDVRSLALSLNYFF